MIVLLKLFIILMKNQILDYNSIYFMNLLIFKLLFFLIFFLVFFGFVKYHILF